MASVDDTLRLLKGMQDIYLTAAEVSVDEAGVKLVGITEWTPPAIETHKSTSAYEGHGEGP